MGRIGSGVRVSAVFLPVVSSAPLYLHDIMALYYYFFDRGLGPGGLLSGEGGVDLPWQI